MTKYGEYAIPKYAVLSTEGYFIDQSITLTFTEFTNLTELEAWLQRRVSKSPVRVIRYEELQVITTTTVQVKP